MRTKTRTPAQTGKMLITLVKTAKHTRAPHPNAPARDRRARTSFLAADWLHGRAGGRAGATLGAAPGSGADWPAASPQGRACGRAGSAGAPRGVIYYIMFVRATCLNIELLGLVGRNGSVQVELRIRER